MDRSEISRRIDDNMFDAFRAVAEVMDGEVHAWGGVVMVASGLPAAAFNPAFITRPLADPEGVLAEVLAYYDSRGLPFLVRMRQGLDPAVEAAAAKLGLIRGHAQPGMVLEDFSRLPDPLPVLDIRTATSDETYDDHARMLERGFEMPAELAAALTATGRNVYDAEMYVGYEDGVPVASSMLFLSRRVAGVFNVATVPEARRRGFGEAMTWHAVRRGAALGAIVSTLQASEMGQPVYTRMGYRVDTHYETFQRESAGE